MAIQLNIYTQIIGVNTISVLVGVMLKTADPGLALYTELMLNCVRITPSILATFYLGLKLGHRPLFLLNGVLIGIPLYCITIGYVISQPIIIIAFLYIYMISFSLFYTPINNFYQTEITTPDKITIANIFNQGFLAITLFFPTIIIEAMNRNVYPIFTFFSLYNTCAMVYIYKCIVETKGRKY